MSFFPLLSAPNCNGWVGLSNFSPNNWEINHSNSQCINVTWASNGIWTTKNLDVLTQGHFRNITASDLVGIVPKDSLPLLSLTSSPMAEKSDLIPQIDSQQNILPVWRATLGLSSSLAKTSYQGELEAFPPQGSLLTFGPLLQFGDGITNHLILLNIESSPVSRRAELEIYVTAGCHLIGKFPLKNNSCNIVPLHDLGFEPEDLPLFICRNMGFIPLYFSSAMNGAYLSLEHTHPPGSLVVHGRRWEAQKLLKNRWFARTLL
jgi:hypothetical protein